MQGIVAKYHIGNPSLINKNPIALFCSREIDLAVYYDALDFINEIMGLPIAVAGGWQSTLEKQALKSRTTKMPSGIVYFLAKGINCFTVPKYLKYDFDKNNLLVLSNWKDAKRIDKKKVEKRDLIIVQTVQRFLFININEGGNLNRLLNNCLQQNKQVYILDHFTNAKWFNNNIQPISVNNLGSLI